jgi:ribosome biogenesis GTPase
MSCLERARVVSQAHELYSVLTPRGERLAAVTGRLRFLDDLPAVGDWVSLTTTDPPLIAAIEPRTSCFTRRSPGGGRQVLAANIDVAFLVCGLDADFNPNRLDRYLVQARQSGARPVVVLNKADLRPELPRLSVDAPVTAISALTGSLAGLTEQVQPGETAALFGSSGVGKSTIVNRLLGAQRQAIGAVPGKHVTTARQLFLLPAGWWLLDMPGLRELALDASAGAVSEAFAEITAQACRYRDCRHEDEPGCAVRDHVDPARLSSYRKLRREQAYAERKEDPAAARAEKERWKKIHKAMRKPG